MTQTRPWRTFLGRNGGSISVELVVVLPLLLWALAAPIVIYDGFRTRYQTEMAAQTIADVMSRETGLFTPDYVEGLADVFDHLNGAAIGSRVRVSSVIWDPSNNRNMLQWSYGAAGLLPLPPTVFAALDHPDPDVLLGSFRGLVDRINLAQTNGDLGGAGVLGNLGSTLLDTLTAPLDLTDAELAAMLPVPDLAARIPPVLPGEALLVVETFAAWQGIMNIGIGAVRFEPVVVVRPRFTPWVNFEGIDPIYPSDAYEVTWTASDAPSDGGGGTLPDEPIPDDPLAPARLSQDFDQGATGWSRDTITQLEPPGGGLGLGLGGFLGPFGADTRDDPLTLSVDMGAEGQRALISFDLLILGDWNGFPPASAVPGGDALSVLIDGEPVALEVFATSAEGQFGRVRRSTAYAAGALVQTEMRLVGPGVLGNTPAARTLGLAPGLALGLAPGLALGRAEGQVWRVRMLVDLPPRRFALGFRALTDAPAATQGFGIDTLRLHRLDRPAGAPPAHFAPLPLASTARDPITGFLRPDGCPDLRHPASFLSLGAADLDNPHRIARPAGGGTDLQTCRYATGTGQVSAAPALIVEFEADATARDLLIAADDGQSGNRCDATLLVRDPNGQWRANDNREGLNPGVLIPAAPSGRYAIWLGTAGLAPCTTDLRLRNP